MISSGKQAFSSGILRDYLPHPSGILREIYRLLRGSFGKLPKKPEETPKRSRSGPEGFPKDVAGNPEGSPKNFRSIPEQLRKNPRAAIADPILINHPSHSKPDPDP
jgi:hypothetical protein